MSSTIYLSSSLEIRYLPLCPDVEAMVHRGEGTCLWSHSAKCRAGHWPGHLRVPIDHTLKLFSLTKVWGSTPRPPQMLRLPGDIIGASGVILSYPLPLSPPSWPPSHINPVAQSMISKLHAWPHIDFCEEQNKLVDEQTLHYLL